MTRFPLARAVAAKAWKDGHISWHRLLRLWVKRLVFGPAAVKVELEALIGRMGSLP